MKDIFISYRREDSSTITGRIYDRLVGVFGKRHVFRDVNAIPLGSDFRTEVIKSINRSGVQLVIIGSQWVSIISQDTRQPRLDNPEDWVRIEVETALRSQIHVVPVLVDNAEMPSLTDLPSSTLQELAHKQALRVRNDPDFDHDMNVLIGHMKKVLGYQASNRFGKVLIALLLLLFMFFLMWLVSNPNGLQLLQGSLSPSEEPQAPQTDSAFPATLIPSNSRNEIWDVVSMEVAGIQMVFVPSGCFMLGTDRGQSDERPVHEVCLSGFWIGRTEITNAQYSVCVASGA
jgi:hypothetical protein